jgi:hypothetical protein
MISNIELCQQRPISGGADRNVSAFPVRCDLNACLQTVTDPLQAPVVNKAHQSSRLRQRAEVSSYRLIAERGIRRAQFAGLPA